MTAVLFPFFASEDARDEQYAAWVQAGGVMQTDMCCVVADIGALRYDAERGAWSNEAAA